MVIIALQFPKTQDFLTGKLENYLQAELQTNVSIGGIYINFPNAVEINEVYLEDQQMDTLLYSGSLKINIGLFGLINKKVNVSRISLTDFYANISREDPDTTFNFDFIIQAFSSDEPATPKDTTSAAWDISVGDVRLMNIRFNYLDGLTGNFVSLNLGRLDVEMDEVDLEENRYAIDNIRLRDTESSFLITKWMPDTTTQEETSSDMELVINQLDVGNVAFTYTNEVSGQTMSLDIGEFLADARQFSLLNQRIILNELVLNNSTVSYQQDPISEEDSLMLTQNLDTTTTEAETQPWQVEVEKIRLSGNDIRMVNNNYEKQPAGMDFNHLFISNLELEVDDLQYNDMDIKGNIRQLAFQEQSGFSIEEFRTILTFSDQEAVLDQLHLQTGNSVIGRSLSLKYPSLDVMSENPGTALLDLNIQDTEIGMRDILYFMPDMAQEAPFKGNENVLINVKAQMTGKVNDLNIEQFYVNMLSNTSLDIKGHITGLPEADQAYIDVTRLRFVSSAGDLRHFLHDSITQQYQIPTPIILTAGFKGKMDDFNAQAILSTNLGDIRTNIAMQPGERYSGNLSINELQLGTILRNDSTFGPLSLDLEVKGQGFSVEQMNTSLDLKLHQAVFNNYSYEGLVLNGKIAESVFDGRMDYQDSSLHFNFNGLVSLNVDTPRYDLTLNILAANLRDLNLTTDDLAFRASLVADLSGNSLNNINGDAGVRNVLIVKDGELYRIDSLLFASITGNRRTSINIDSDLLTASFKGAINLEDLGPVLNRHFSQYYSLDEVIPPDTLLEQDFEFEIQLHNPELLTEVLVPGLSNFVPGTITGKYDSREVNLHIDIMIPHLVYQNYTVDTLTMYVDSDEDFLNFGSSINRFAIGSNEITNLAVVGQVYDNQIDTRLQITDFEYNEQYSIGGTFVSLEDGYRFQLDPRQLILNYDDWNLPESNFIEFSSKPVIINDVTLSRSGQSLAIGTSVNDQSDSILSVQFSDFSLETISQLIQRDSSLINGVLNGHLNLNQSAPSFSFTSDLSINTLALMGVELGNLVINAATGNDERINLDAALSGNENDVRIAGYYFSEEETNEMNITVDLNQLNLAALAGPLQGTLSDTKGFIRGNMKIGGSTDNPEINGVLNFNQAEFFVEYLQTKFSLKNERIVFNNRGIQFDRFNLVDARGNTARLNGFILTDNYTDFSFDLTAIANNFEMMNSSEGDNEMMYGRVVVDLEMKVTGTMVQPNVNMDVRVKESTNLTYLLTETMPATVEIEGLVEFIAPEKGPDRILADAMEEEPDEQMTSELTGLDLTANIRVDKNATLSIIIDPDAGDHLITRANPSSLSLNMDQVGNITLTGTFEIGSGAYELSFYELVRRRFEIREGSRITWTGNPMNANLDITAIHTVQASPAGIMPETTDPRKVPVQALLTMRNELMSPEISFGLGVDEDVTSGMANELRIRLQQLDEADVNRQVFALLVLQRFLAENPFENPGGGGGVEATARNSVSQILTNQLNNLSQQIGGVDISFGVQSQEGLEGYETQLDVTLSKSLFNDRLTVKVGGNIDIEGGDQNSQERRSGLGNYIGDIIVEYRLTPSGNLLLQFFREQSYEFFYTDLIETGIGIIYNRNYNRFSELFKSPEEDEESPENEARK